MHFCNMEIDKSRMVVLEKNTCVAELQAELVALLWNTIFPGKKN